MHLNYFDNKLIRIINLVQCLTSFKHDYDNFGNLIYRVISYAEQHQTAVLFIKEKQLVKTMIIYDQSLFIYVDYDYAIVILFFVNLVCFFSPSVCYRHPILRLFRYCFIFS